MAFVSMQHKESPLGNKFHLGMEFMQLRHMSQRSMIDPDHSFGPPGARGGGVDLGGGHGAAPRLYRNTFAVVVNTC